MKAIKYIISALLLSIALVGCKTEKIQVIQTDQNGQPMKAEFNKETYVWESWIFPDNKAEK